MMMQLSDSLQSRYEVVIIGAGIGGLTAACYLALEGVQVLVIEGGDGPGGACKGGDIEGHRFDLGASLFYGLDAASPLGWHARIAEELELPLKPVPVDPLVTYHTPSGPLAIHKDRHETLAQLANLFPNQIDKLRQFFLKMQEYAAGMQQFPVGSWEHAKDLPRLLLRHNRFLLTVLGHSGLTAGDVFQKFVSNKRAKNILDLDCLSFGLTDASRTPALLAALYLQERHEGGGWYIEGGSQAFSEALVDTLKRFGGEVVCGRPVSQVTVEGGTATGVTLEDGAHIKALAVVSTASLQATFFRMVPLHQLDPAFLRKVRFAEYTDPVEALFLGVGKDAFPKGTEANHIEILAHDSEWRKMEPVWYQINSLLDPGLAPEGRHNLRILAPRPYHQPGGRDLLMERAEIFFPGLSGQVAVERYFSPEELGKALGRVNAGSGLAMTPEQSFQFRFRNHTPIKGMYLVGENCLPGLGVLSTSLNGRIGAAHVLEDLAPRTFAFYEDDPLAPVETEPEF